MLAELHGKFSVENSDTIERSEDVLTDAVFSAVRYLPRRVLGAILAAVGIRTTSRELEDAQIELWPRMHWRAAHRQIEPDVRVLVGRQPVIFEAKLHSPFQEYKLTTDATGEALHQLAVQYAVTADWAAGLRLAYPVVVGVTPAAVPRQGTLDAAVASLTHLGVHADASRFQWLPWNEIADILSNERTDLRVHEKTLVDDLLRFMELRGVRRVFTGFKPEDYWLVSAAQRVAGERVYPQIRDFIEDLANSVKVDGIGWSQPTYRSMWLPLGASSAKPLDWTRSWLGVQLWPDTWPKRTGRAGANVALYVLFDFVDPAVEVGLSIPGPNVATAQSQWATRLPDMLAAAARTLPDAYAVVRDTGDLARPPLPNGAVSLPEADSAWAAAAIATMVGTAHLRLRRRLDPLNVEVQDVRLALLETRDLLTAVGDPLWDLLRSVGYIG